MRAMMRTCPKCEQATLLEVRDINPKLHEWVCLTCAYYESNSEAFARNPTMFSHLGIRVIARLTTNLKELGLNEEEARAWLQNEPEIVRGIVSPLEQTKSNTRRRQTRRYQSFQESVGTSSFGPKGCYRPFGARHWRY